MKCIYNIYNGIGVKHAQVWGNIYHMNLKTVSDAVTFILKAGQRLRAQNRFKYLAFNSSRLVTLHIHYQNINLVVCEYCTAEYFHGVEFFCKLLLHKHIHGVKNTWLQSIGNTFHSIRNYFCGFKIWPCIVTSEIQPPQKFPAIQ